jgi:Domain of unknown function (DUF4148)
MKSLSSKSLVVASGLAILAAFTALPAAAENLDYSYPSLGKFESTKTRAEVRAELFKAIHDGSLAQNTNSGPLITPASPASRLSREAVLADAIEWTRAQNSSHIYMGGR